MAATQRASVHMHGSTPATKLASVPAVARDVACRAVVALHG